MGLLRNARAWLGASLRRRRFEADLDEELRLHLELREEKNRAAGMGAAEARQDALRSFGGVGRAKEDVRGVLGLHWLHDLAQDLRYGARSLGKWPLFTVIAVSSLALAIGAATSVFSLVNAVLLGSLPVPDPQELRIIHWSGITKHFSYWGVGGWDGVRNHGNDFSLPAYRDLRSACREDAEVFGYVPTYEGVLARARHETMSAQGFMVTGNFFAALRVRPLFGSLLGEEDDRPGADRRVVISYHWWESQFDLDPGVLGRQMLLNGSSYTVVGVLPRGFSGIRTGKVPADLYFTISAQPHVGPQGWRMDSPDSWYVALMARLRPGVRPEHFGAVIDAAFKGISGKYLGEPAAAVLNGRQGIDENRGDYGRVLMPLLGTVGVMLLIACANLAGMLLARGSARRHELSIRGALGAGRGRLVRQLMAECLLLTLVGGALGTLAAGWGGMLLGRVLAGSTSAFKYDARMDWRVLGFALALVVVTALVSGIYPALKAGSAKSAGPGPMRGGSRSRAGGTLVVAQICLSLILVVVAGLYARTLSNLLGVSPGFSVENLLIFHANPGNLRMTDAEVRTYYSSVQDALRPMPGVTSASLMPYPFLSNTSQVDDVAVPGREKDGGAAHEANSMDVGDSFFETLGIRILAGRGIIVSDTANAPKVAVVNSAFVRQFFGGEAPIGRVIRVRGSDWRVVGVCADTRFSRLWQPSHPTMYFPFRQQTPGSAFFAVRTALPPASIAAQVRRAVDRINPAIAVDDVSTQRELLDATIGPQRIVAALCGSLAALTLALSCAGLYGLISHDVARRTGEIGVRMALGASKAQILGPVLRWALAIGGLGIAAGLPLSYAVARVYCTNLFGLTTGDPATYAGSGALMMAVTLLAAAVPARRASCVDPLAALRCE